MSLIIASRYHDFSCGHRVVGHEGKCALLHGHNYRVHFHCRAEQLDSVGRVVDFSIIKSTLCQWLEDNWDHKFLAWQQDNFLSSLHNAAVESQCVSPTEFYNFWLRSIVLVPFNPTAENMARYLVDVVAPGLLPDGIALEQCVVEETRKCSATYIKE